MKKYAAFLIMLAVLLTAGILCASAASQESGYWVENAKNIDEILAGEAGEREVGWEVPFLHIQPTIDGEIGKTEYMPFELYEDYLSWMAPVGNEASGTTEEEFKEFYDSTQQDFFDAWWGWDGVYMYIAFEINCLNGYKCDPEQDVLLYAYNCLQVGFADVGCAGKDDSYVELGCGIHSETGKQITFNWAGQYCPEAGTDFVGSYDAENQVLIYEMRVNLQAVMGLDRLVENDDEVNYGWILAVNGQAQNTNETWQLAFTHGIGGQYSGKCPQYFARITFTGKPDGLEIKPVEIPGMSEEDKEFKLMELIDCSDKAVVDTLDGEFAGVEYITEGEESFMRVTSYGSDENIPYVYSNKYPKNVLGGQADYVVVKYRTSYADAEDLGFIFRTVNTPEYNLENCYFDTIGGDGEWHTVVFYMMDDASWNHFIMNIGFVPFVYDDNAAQQYIDIAWIKFYQMDPYDLYIDSIFGEGSDETDPPAEETTEAVEETTASEETTAAPDSVTTEAPVEEPVEKKGCGSVVGFGAVAVLSAMAAAVALSRRERE